MILVAKKNIGGKFYKTTGSMYIPFLAQLYCFFFKSIFDYFQKLHFNWNNIIS